MEFQVLGPLTVRRQGESVALGPAKQRAVLAILLVHANELVPIDRLTDDLWPRPPATAANTLQVYVHKLRKALDPERPSGTPSDLLVTRAPGYILRVGTGELDANRFEGLTADGRAAARANDPTRAADILRRALALWRGPAFAEFAYDPFAQSEIARLEELRLDAVEERIEAELRLGEGADLVGELEALVSDNPLRERLRQHLMLALYRTGRQAEALEVYEETRLMLADELGLTPSPALQRLQAAILRQEPTLEPAIAESDGAGPTVSTQGETAQVRKTVTVMMVRRSAHRGADPEALSRQEDAYRADLVRTVERHGGTVASSLGNEVMAVFGVPHAHEDDALRAVSAAFEIRDGPRGDGVPSGPNPRIGIVTGEVLASGSGARALSVVGDPVTAAGELENVAAAGEILLGPETERLVRPIAVGETIGTRAGRAWRVTELRGQRPAVGSLTAPLVGRQRELDSLRAAFRRVARERTPHLFTILGVAGLGKSRLAQEFATDVEPAATVVVGRCVPYGEGITFWSLREIANQLTSAGTEANSLLDAIGDSGTAAEREEIFWATRNLFVAAASHRPLVVFFEDVHWAEPTLLDLIEYLAETTRGVPILLVCIARPELLEQRPTWNRERPVASSLRLEPLPDADCEILIGNLVGGLAQETTARVLETAEGNPLFIEQLVAMLGEGGPVGERPIPPTIDALLSARLDRLGPGERAVISRAAVIGKEFSADAALGLLPEEARVFGSGHLEALVRKELIGPGSPAPAVSFRFRHILIQQAAYRATPKALRAELHERIAEWIADPDRGEAAEPAEVVGYHFEQAFRYRAQLGPVGRRELDLARRAAQHLAAAGRQAFKRGDMPATVNLLRRAAGLPSLGGGVGTSALPELGYALFEIGEVDEASAVLVAARDRAREDGDRRVEWLVTITRPRIEMYKDPAGNDIDALLVETEAAIDALTDLDDDAGLARGHMVLSDLLWSQGRLQETSAAATRAAEYARLAGNRREVGWALGQNALCAIHGPMPVPDGLGWLERLLIGEPENRTLDANLAGFVALLEAMDGRFDEARRHLLDSRALARDLGLIWQAGVQELLSAYVELLAGNPVAAERDIVEAENVFRSIGEGWFLSTAVVDLPRAVYEQGRYEDAHALLAAIDEHPAPTDREWQVKRTGVPARLLARSGRFDEAEALARQGVALAADSEFVVLHADVLLDLAEVLSLAGRHDESEIATAEAVSLYERKGDVAAAAIARRPAGPS